MNLQYQREESPDTIVLTGDRCQFIFRRLCPGVVRVSILGYDRGEFGTAALDEISAEIVRFGPIELFVDTSSAEGATWEVSRKWTQWFNANRDVIRRVNILTLSKYLHQTISVSKELSRTGDLIAIYDDPAKFDQALRRRVNAGQPDPA